MIGRRHDCAPREMKPGEFGRWPEHMNLGWFCMTPNGASGNLGKHKVEEHPDGTITVSPSILVTASRLDGGEDELYHGWLRRGVWTST